MLRIAVLALGSLSRCVFEPSVVVPVVVVRVAPALRVVSLVLEFEAHRSESGSREVDSSSHLNADKTLCD